MITSFVGRVFAYIRTPATLRTQPTRKIVAADLRACAADSLRAAGRAQAHLVLQQQFAPAFGLTAPQRPQGRWAQARQIGEVGAWAAHRSYVANPRCPSSDALAQQCARMVLQLKQTAQAAPAAMQVAVPSATTSAAPAASAAFAVAPAPAAATQAVHRARPTALMRPRGANMHMAAGVWRRLGGQLLRSCKFW